MMPSDQNFSTWNDSEFIHAELATYCKKNGIKINFVYNALIKKYLDDPDIIKS